MKYRILGTVVLFGLVGRGEAEDAGLVAPGAVLEKLGGDFQFTEGPTAEAAGNVYFTDHEPKWRRATSSNETTWREAKESAIVAIFTTYSFRACCEN